VVRARPGTIEEKIRQLRELEQQVSPEQLADFRARLEMSWIHHDSALEGTVYDPTELHSALAGTAVTDAAVAPYHDEIRQHRAAIALIRELALKRKLEITVDTVRAIYDTLEPEAGDPKGPPKYRKDMPLHRVYFHEISTPDKIPNQVRAMVQWLGSEEAKRTMHPTRLAARAHYQLLHIFPFAKHSGKVARLLMNLILMHEGYPPAIIHATDRQRYYDALKSSPDAVSGIVQEALENAVESTLRYFQRLLGIEEETP
jgi:Fic family protein